LKNIDSIESVKKFVVRPLTGERVVWKGPSGYRCEGEAVCVKEWHSSRCEARGPCTDLFEPNKEKGYPCGLCWREKPASEAS